jgi:hypothetical protein
VTAEFEELYGRLARRSDRRRAERKDVVAAG